MGTPLTALIVDDEPLARQELLYLLEAAGDVTVVAQGTNGIEAVELIRTHKPDVIFLDVRMPGLDGFAVLKKVLALDKKAKLPQIVFATAFDQYAVRAFEVNAVDYLLKPFDSKRVVKTLEKVRGRVETPAEAAPGDATPPVARLLAGRVAGAEAKLDALLRMVEEQAAMATGAAPMLAAGGQTRSGKVVVRAASFCA
jgi:two-component system LytT family response regulator/two-component system response regulator LytT